MQVGSWDIRHAPAPKRAVPTRGTLQGNFDLYVNRSCTAYFLAERWMGRKSHDFRGGGGGGGGRGVGRRKLQERHVAQIISRVGLLAFVSIFLHGWCCFSMKLEDWALGPGYFGSLFFFFFSPPLPSPLSLHCVLFESSEAVSHRVAALGAAQPSRRSLGGGTNKCVKRGCAQPTRQ